MKYAILGDIHSNLEGLTKVLDDAEAQGVTHYACVGDVVGYNANPVECIELMRRIDCRVVRGNHDHYCACDTGLNSFKAVAAGRGRIDAWQIVRGRIAPICARCATWRRWRVLRSSTSPFGHTGVVAVRIFDALEAEAHFNYQSTTVCFFGHTHRPVVYEKSDGVRFGLYSTLRVELGVKYFVNVGSVGQPHDGDPRATYVIYEPAAHKIRLRRVDYDYRLTQQKIKAAGLPRELADRLAVGA